MEENLEIISFLKSEYNLSDANFEQISNLGISVNKIKQQLFLFQNGIPKINLEKPATINDGILKLTETENEKFASVFDLYKNNLSIEKFIPASGAASRMFKHLSEFLLDFKIENETINAYINRKNDTDLSSFIIGMDKFPFFEKVYKRLKEKYPNFDSLTRDYKNFYFIETLLDNNEFNFTNKPKAILPFHGRNSAVLTPIDEHLKESSLINQDNQKIKLHFTISIEHRKDFEAIIANSGFDNLEVTFSEQQKETDTIAVDFENKALFDNNGNLIFRPGGHGALINNLNNLQSDLVFIKNIDNVSYSNAANIVYYKKVLAGYLITMQQQIFKFLHVLDQTEVGESQKKEVRDFIENELKIILPINFDKLTNTGQLQNLKTILNRPIRVCGMVINENEPGGGPFWIKDQSNEVSLQIIESSQIDTKNINQIDIFKKATHFNPVDIVCSFRDYKNNKFNLLEFVDHNSGFIVEKSKNGVSYKAYELPGLWNGAMANWITIFVEVPVITFNPVKTVNDLLKHNHQLQ